jgi:galactokinase
VRRKLTSGVYNTRHDECDIALRLINQISPEIHSFRDVSLPDLKRYLQVMPAVIARRARHVVSEINRTIQAQALLKKGDIQAFGRLINETHASLRDDYEVSCPELDIMVSIAQSLDGCLGARLTGAGFGGCTVNLVEADKTDSFIQELTREYTAQTNLTPAVYLTHASQGAEILE